MKPHWHHHPETVERIAAEYALGTLTAGGRRRLRALMRERQDISRAVSAWNDRLGGALSAQRPMPVRPVVWERLEARLFGSPIRQAPPKASWWMAWLSPAAGAALAMGLALGVLIGPNWEALRSPTQLPESYVGVLANASGKPGLIVSSLRRGTTVDLKQLSPVELPTGKTLFLWVIDKTGAVQPVAAIPSGAFVSANLSEAAEKVFFPAVELAVSVEQTGALPDKPSGPFVYRGLCGKLWKLPAK